MGSSSNRRKTHPIPNNITPISSPDFANPDAIPNTRQTIPKSTIDAHYAKLAREHSYSNTSDHARQVYMKRQLVDQFGHQFGMSEAHAKAAVEEEMKTRYQPNPWDAPCQRKPRPQRRMKATEGLGKERAEAGEVKGCSEEQWDLFERVLGYR